LTGIAEPSPDVQFPGGVEPSFVEGKRFGERAAGFGAQLPLYGPSWGKGPHFFYFVLEAQPHKREVFASAGLGFAAGHFHFGGENLELLVVGEGGVNERL